MITVKNTSCNTIVVAAAVAMVAASLSSAASLRIPAKGIPTISHAMVSAKEGDTVWVSNGVYKEKVILKSRITLIASSPFGATIDGGGRGIVVSLSQESSIIGFEIRNGTVGVMCNQSGCKVMSCRIVSNSVAGVICVAYLPGFEDNVVAFNGGNAIQINNARSMVSSINHNTIAYNAGHGISMDKTTEVSIENNIIAFNERLPIKTPEQIMPSQFRNNNLYGNLRILQKIPTGNMVLNPLFVAPRGKKDFTLSPKSLCRDKASDGADLGARFTSGDRVMLWK
jgi:hypothetical protein